MSVQCTNCGQALPRDDARFCSKCGTPVLPRPLSPQTLSSQKNAPVASDGKGKVHKDRSALREQIAQQSPFQPPKRPRPTQDFPPPWISELSTLEHTKMSPPEVEADDQSHAEIKADRLTEIPTTSLPSMQDKQSSEDGPLPDKNAAFVDADQSDVPTVVIAPQKSQVRGLHVKVWEQEESAALPEVPGLEDSSRELTHHPPDGSTWGINSNIPLPVMGMQTPRLDEVTHLDTERFPTQQQVKPKAQDVASLSDSGRAYINSFDGIAPGSQIRRPAQPSQLQPADWTPLRNSEAMARSIPVGQYTPVFVHPAPIKRRRSPFPLLFAILLLCIIVAGGVLAWTYFFQPFTIPPVSQPQQSFRNAGLGVALSYPNGWMVQLNQDNGTVQFSDSTHTDRFSVLVVAATGQDTSKYLLQEAKQLGITGAKSGPPLSFAKTSWQQVQGSVVQDGVNYSETLLVTMHANRLYSIIQQAPQATYPDEDRVIFSTIRSSFQFLL